MNEPTGSGIEIAAVIESNRRECVAYAYRVTHDVGDAEDAYQTAAMKMCARKEPVRDPAPFLKICVKRAALDILRWRKRHGIQSMPMTRTEDDGPYDAADPSAWRTTAAFDAKDAARFVLRRMKESGHADEARALARFACGWTVARIAAAEHVTPAAVKMRMHHGRARARALVGAGNLGPLSDV